MTPVDPVVRFQEALERARSAETADPTAAALATADTVGRPSVRMVLLRSVDFRGFVFYTNLESRKAADLAENPRAALCVHWPASAVQVRIEGPVENVSREEADLYFASRPRGHQLAAWASRQSAPLASRAELIARFEEAEARYAGREVDRPPFWAGYRLLPQRMEFWQERENRLHERVLYTREKDRWTAQALYP
jgi:pyridoxamine 5'-phosphate oxidase